jgi:outer membrane protein assembly factor BamB
VFVAAIDSHTVHALDAQKGTALWSFTAGARVDSPPTIHRGLVLFGSADGYVHALRAGDGALAWRFRAAPVDLRHAVLGQIESVWPVHGSVLVKDGVLYCTAGRSIFLDGGIRFLRLDPVTGRKLGEVVWDEKDPESGKNMQIHVRGLHMPVALSDVLSSDGTHIYMRSQKIDVEGKRLEIPVEGVDNQPAEGSHLFCQIGFLDDSWFHRSFWTFGRRVNGGYGGWFQAGRVVPAGRILVFDDQQVYGYGRKPQYYVNASVLEHHLFAARKHVDPATIAAVRRATQRMNRRSNRRNATSSDWKLLRAFPSTDITAARYQWTFDQPAVQVRALVAAGDTLVVGGHPDVIDERRAYRLPDEPDTERGLRRQEEALAGRLGGRLWLVSKADGKPAAQYRLDSPPVFDGMAVAQGRLVVCTLDGAVECLASGGQPLARVDEPTQVISDEPEEPGYLKPPEVDKSGDFSKVTRCRVVQSKLGYRLIANATDQVGMALRKLDAPITGNATLKAKIMVPAGMGLLTNGFIAFGDGATVEKLVHCGIRYQPKKAMISQGSLKGKAQAADLAAELDKVYDLAVRVDLKAQKVTFTASGVSVEAKLSKPMRRISHVGYSMDNALVDFSNLEVTPE